MINETDFSATYSIVEIVRLATHKIKAYDRDIPMSSDMWGGRMPDLVKRWKKFTNWQQQGVQKVKVFFRPEYFLQNNIVDPLHMQYVVKYAGIKD